LFADVIEHLRAAVFEHVGDKFKPGASTVVGIGNLGKLVIRVFAEGGEAFDFGEILRVSGEGGYVLVVIIIHREDEIEIEVILRGELSGFSRDRDIAVLQCPGHAFVGCSAGVVVVGAGGVDVDEVSQTCRLDLVSEDVFSGRGAANVSQTDKDDVKRRSWHDAWML